MPQGAIGVFDSGLGGLFVFRSLVHQLPLYAYTYLGDTKRVPYGDRSHDVLRQFLEEGVDFLFRHGCELVIVACNTASASALRKIQQEYLPAHYPHRRVLGVIIPTAETCRDAKRIGILATQATVTSETFVKELKKINPNVEVFQKAAPLLVPLIENNELEKTEPFLKEYLEPLLAEGIDTLILGCTHYGILKDRIKKIIGDNIRIVSEDEIVPEKLKHYLARHPEIESRLSKDSSRHFMVTDINDHYTTTAKMWFGEGVALELTNLTS